MASPHVSLVMASLGVHPSEAEGAATRHVVSAAIDDAIGDSFQQAVVQTELLTARYRQRLIWIKMLLGAKVKRPEGLSGPPDSPSLYAGI